MNGFARLGGVVAIFATVSLSNAFAESTVIVSLAGEAFDGPPQFDLLIGDTVVGTGTLARAIETETDGRLFTKPRPSAFLEEFRFQVPDAMLLPDKDIAIVLTNDKFSERAGQGEDGIFDRNLFIDFIRVNGLELTSADIALTAGGKVQRLNYQAGLLPIYEAGQKAVAIAPAEGWPEASLAVSAVSTAIAPVPAMASWTRQALEDSAR